LVKSLGAQTDTTKRELPVARYSSIQYDFPTRNPFEAPYCRQQHIVLSDTEAITGSACAGHFLGVRNAGTKEAEPAIVLCVQIKQLQLPTYRQQWDGYL